MSADDASVSGARLPVASARTVVRAVAAVIGWWRVPGLILLLLAAAAMGVVGPFALGTVVDALAANGAADAGAIVVLGVVMAAAVLVGAALTTAGMIAVANLFERALADLREAMVVSALRLPPERIERAGTGDLIARAGDDVAEVSDAIPRVVPALVGALFTIVVSVVGMAVIDPWFAVAFLAVVPVHVVAVRRYLRTAPGVYAAERRAMSDRAQHLLDSLRGIESVRAYGLAPAHLARIGTASWQVVRWTMRARAVQNVFFARLNAAEFLGMTALLTTGFLLVSSGAATVGATTAAMLLFLRLFGPINQLLFVVDDLQSALASLGRIIGVSQSADVRAPVSPSASASPSAATPRVAAGSGTVQVREVHASYDGGASVLHGVDLDLPPGHVAALVGPSGAGKTTLAMIVAGVHDPVAGHVDRADPVVLVTQQGHLFDTSLRENLTLAAPGATDDEVLDALRRVGGSDIVARMPRRLDEPVGASGTQLTPAEAQIVALARVILADPRIVVLDEATAESGSTEAGRLESAADAVTAGRTALVVAHRLSQAATADQVLVMASGRIAEQGTHDALVASGGAYARLWRAWNDPLDVG